MRKQSMNEESRIKRLFIQNGIRGERKKSHHRRKGTLSVKEKPRRLLETKSRSKINSKTRFVGS